MVDFATSNENITADIDNFPLSTRNTVEHSQNDAHSSRRDSNFHVLSDTQYGPQNTSKDARATLKRFLALNDQQYPPLT